MNLSKVKLNTWSIETSPVHEIEAKALGLQQWTLEKAKSGTFFSDFNLPLVVHDAKSMPKDGEWRKFGLDKDVYPFFDRWYDVKETSANDLGYTVEEKNLMLDTFKHACCHWPVHIYFIELSPDIELKIFIKSMDIIQKLRSDEEKHADTGWETCCHVARARDLGKKVSQQTGDDLAQAEDILAKVKWAQSSDVKFQASSHKATSGVQSQTKQPAKKEEANSKKIEEILRFYDRCKEHNCTQILVTAHVEFPKGVLDMLSKLRVFSRKLGPLKCEVCGESGLAFGLKLACLRLKTGQMDVSRTARKLEFDDYDALKGPTRENVHFGEKFRTSLT